MPDTIESLGPMSDNTYRTSNSPCRNHAVLSTVVAQVRGLDIF